ncbi:MAG: acetyl-CoA carboxylase carboxyltransferase subunit alpha [Spirochaetaceae bacterium]|nr:acetyl-CoA carboxylase carboxyltransferase subunit alpha [Spirochaetaceae bacterium]
MASKKKTETAPKTAFEKKLAELKTLAGDYGSEITTMLGEVEKKVRETSDNSEVVWKQVALARHPDRPYSLDYIERVFDGFVELHGDRAFGDDAAIVGGLAMLDGRPVTIIASQKGRTLKDNMRRNSGMANPEGYRKALRLARQAEKFHRPIITFVDTSGAYPGVGAEERGIGEAIARNLRDFSHLATPVICIIIGEGGSGGALGIGVGDKIYMLENAIYSVISPEGAASILLHDSGKAKEAAAMLRITSSDLLDFGLINGVIKEPAGGAHANVDETAAAIKETLIRDLKDLVGRTPQVLVRYRTQKIRKIGRWSE